MLCEQKERLLRQYEQAASMFSRSLTELQRAIRIINAQEYNRAMKDVERFRADSEQARLVLESHTREHGC